jgi:hypothetical protein
MAASGPVAFTSENPADLISSTTTQIRNFKPLDVETITKLRHLCAADGGVFFITHSDGQKTDRILIEEAQRELLNWVAGIVQRPPRPIE